MYDFSIKVKKKYHFEIFSKVVDVYLLFASRLSNYFPRCCIHDEKFSPKKINKNKYFFHLKLFFQNNQIF